MGVRLGRFGDPLPMMLVEAIAHGCFPLLQCVDKLRPTQSVEPQDRSAVAVGIVFFANAHLFKAEFFVEGDRSEIITIYFQRDAGGENPRRSPQCGTHRR